MMFQSSHVQPCLMNSTGYIRNFKNLLGKGNQQSHASWCPILLPCGQSRYLVITRSAPDPAQPTQVSAPATCGSSMRMETSRSTTRQRWGGSRSYLACWQSWDPHQIRIFLLGSAVQTIEHIDQFAAAVGAARGGWDEYVSLCIIMYHLDPYIIPYIIPWMNYTTIQTSSAMNPTVELLKPTERLWSVSWFFQWIGSREKNGKPWISHMKIMKHVRQLPVDFPLTQPIDEVLCVFIWALQQLQSLGVTRTSWKLSCRCA